MVVLLAGGLFVSVLLVYLDAGFVWFLFDLVFMACFLVLVFGVIVVICAVAGC